MKQKNASENQEIDLLQLLAALWHGAWVIVMAVVIFGSAAFCYARYFVTPLYKASAMLYINNNSFSVGSSSISLADLNTSKSLVDTYLVIMRSRTTLNEVIRRAGVGYSYEQLRGMVSGGAVNDTQILEINVTGPDPEEATVITNVLAEVLPQRVYDITDGSAVRVVDYAVVPAGKDSPSITRYTAMGMLLGFVLSCGIIFLLDLMDDQVRDTDFLTKTFGLSVLATVPDLVSSRSGKGYYRYQKAEASPDDGGGTSDSSG